jgi:hypothetical protein
MRREDLNLFGKPGDVASRPCLTNRASWVPSKNDPLGRALALGQQATPGQLRTHNAAESLPDSGRSPMHRLTCLAQSLESRSES